MCNTSKCEEVDALAAEGEGGVVKRRASEKRRTPLIGAVPELWKPG